MTQTLLAVDVGGTKCELALFDRRGTDYVPLVRTKYLSGNHAGLEEIIRLFLQETGESPEVASMGVAGVVGDDVATITNLPWVIEGQALARKFGFSRVKLFNDLTAVCASIALLQKDDLLQLQTGKVQKGELIGVIAPGTGLGEGVLVQNDSLFFPRGSEGGHADFAPVTEEQTQLLRWMLEKESPVSYEMLIAGPGIPNLYDFYRDRCGHEESEKVRQQLQLAKDRTPIIFQEAFGTDPCPLCRRVVELFLSILGSEAGNLALKLYAKGGLYIGGGIVPRLADKISFDFFLESFLDKGIMRSLMESIPIHLIMKKDAALIGAARYGREELLR